MYQKALVRQAWEQAGLYHSRDARLRQFLKQFDQAPGECWADLVALYRADYSRYLEKLALPIWNTGDKLLRLNLIRAIDFQRPEEQKFVRKLVRQLNPQVDALELREIITAAPLAVLDQVARRQAVPVRLRTLLELRRAQLSPP